MLPLIIIQQHLNIRSERLNQLLEESSFRIPHPDLLYFEDQSKLGVEQAKQIKNHFSFKPYSAKGKALVLESAQNLTLDAQNSLLKLLEEPPEKAVILLGIENESQLLPTILSRCQTMHLAQCSTSDVVYNEVQSYKNIEELINFSIEKRFQYIEKLDKREEFLSSLLGYFREKMYQDPKLVSYNKLLLQALEWKKQNVNLRAILEYLMLNLPQLSS